MYNKTIEFYDKIYSWKNYRKECLILISFINHNKKNNGNTLLDISCGTGTHIKFLKEEYKVEGIDISPEMIKLAREKNPEIKFHIGDMIDFSVEKKFDIITSLFSSIAYLKTLDNLLLFIKNCSKHLKKDGLLIIEPWYSNNTFKNNLIGTINIEENDIKIVNMYKTSKKDKLAKLEFNFLVGKDNQIEYFKEIHELALFEKEDIITLLENENFEVQYDESGLMGRGLFICKKRS